MLLYALLALGALEAVLGNDALCGEPSCKVCDLERFRLQGVSIPKKEADIDDLCSKMISFLDCVNDFEEKCDLGDALVDRRLRALTYAVTDGCRKDSSNDSQIETVAIPPSMTPRVPDNDTPVRNGTPEVPKFTSKPHGDQKTKYTIAWTVDSHTPVDEYSLKYRKMYSDEDWESEIVPATDTREGYIHTQKLKLLDLEAGTSYEAVVTARNKFGWSKLSDVFVFTTKNEEEYDDIEEQPHFLSTSKTVKATTGETVELPCAVDDLGEFVLIWKKEKNIILFAGEMRIIRDDRIKVDKTSLVISNILPRDSGDYICEISTHPPLKLYHSLDVL